MEKITPEAHTPRLSVIIPTFNQRAALLETLRALGEQSLPPDQFEVFVVDDGSTDSTSEQIARLEVPFALRVLQQPNQGPAAARNLGATRAAGELLLFLDADIIAAPQLLAQHRHSHDNQDRALVVGRRAPWPPACTSRFSQVVDMDTCIPDGPITCQEALSTNLSIQAGHFRQLGGFDETLRAAEDVELACRATQIGMAIVYNGDALGYHNHPTDLAAACRKSYVYHTFYPPLWQRHPELRDQVAHLRDKKPLAWGQDPVGLVARKLARQLLATPPFLKAMEALVDLLERYWPAPRLLRFWYWKILGSYQLRGLRAGLGEQQK